LGDTKTDTFGTWTTRYMGWNKTSAMATSHSYSDVYIVRLPAKLPQMQEAAVQIQALVQEARTSLGLDDPDEGSDLEEADVRARIRHRRGLKRTFINLTSPDDGAEVRVPFHKRRRDHSAVTRGQETLRLLTVAGVQPLNAALLRSLGYGGPAAKMIIAAGPSGAVVVPAPAVVPAAAAPVVVPVPAVVPEAAAAVVDEDAMLED
jgi:hypothetical protein